MNWEEFQTTYKKATRQYTEAMELMKEDAPFMQDLPDRILKLVAKMLDLIKHIRANKTRVEAQHQMNILKEVLAAAEKLGADVKSFFDDTVEDWKRLHELTATYNKHCFPGENMPKTKEAGAEWVTQLEATSAEMLGIYKAFNQRIIIMRKEYNKLMLETQPYLN